MKIVFFNPIGEIGGAERVLLLLLTELGKSDRSSQFTLILGDDGPLRTAAERIGVPTHVLRLPKSSAAFGDSDISTGRGGFIRLIRKSLLAAVAIPATLGYLLRLRSTIGRLKPDILHANGIKAQLLAALVRPRGVKLVWHLHDFIGDRALVSRLMRRLSHRATIAVANSESVRNDAASLLAPLEVRTIYNGIDVDRFTPGTSDVATIDRPAGFGSLRPDAIRVGLVATYARWKGQETFLEAAAEILRRCPESPLYFYIVGGPIYRTHGSQYSLDELRGVAEKLGIADRVGFVPFQPDTVAVYRALDIVVHASTKREPFGLTIAEAMSCGRAVIVAAAGGAAELTKSGTNALTFRPGEASGLAEAIMSLATNPTERRRLGQAGRATCIERFSAASFAEKFRAVYSELARHVANPSATASEGGNSVRADR